MELHIPPQEAPRYSEYDTVQDRKRRRFLELGLRATQIAVFTGVAGLLLKACGDTAPAIPDVPNFSLPESQHDLIVFMKSSGQPDPASIPDFEPQFAKSKQFMKDQTYGKISVDYTTHPTWVTATTPYTNETSDAALLAIEGATFNKLGLDASKYNGVIFVSTGGQAFGFTAYSPDTKTFRTNVTVSSFYDTNNKLATDEPNVLEHELIHGMARSGHDGFVQSTKLNDYGSSAIARPAYGASLMGGVEGGNLPPILSGLDRVALGVITSANIQTITGSGLTAVTISELQNPNVPGNKIARIPLYDASARSFSEFLYVEYRADRVAAGDGGVEIRRWDEKLSDNDYQETIDKKVSQDTYPGGIQPVIVMKDGDTFYDAPHGVHVKQVSHTATTVNLQIVTPQYT